jgi:hypothetical protein
VKPLTKWAVERGVTVYESDKYGEFYHKDEADALFAEKDAHIADLAARFVQRERDISDDTRTIAMLEARIAALEAEPVAKLAADGGRIITTALSAEAVNALDRLTSDRKMNAQRAIEFALLSLPPIEGAPFAWRWPGGCWVPGIPSAADHEVLERERMAPEYAFAAPQPHGGSNA